MDALENWHEFNVAIVGAAAALAGLVIVAASVNIGDIVKFPSLTARLSAAISGLVLALTVSSVGLVPDIPPLPHGVLVVLVSVLSLAFPASAARRVYENRSPANRARAAKVVVAVVSPLSYLVGGALLMAGLPGGYVLFAVGAILAIIASLLVSWVVLVEVLR